MKKLKLNIFDIFPLALIILTLILSVANYTKGTFLTGWDTLHPEFNFGLNLQRTFFGVWRAEQGLGALAAHAHMAELPRILFLWVTSLFFETRFLRYFYIFFTLLIGPLGVWRFVRYTIGKPKNYAANLAAFLAAAYYLLNLGTVQHYYVPFEMFPTQFAFLPWAFYLATKYFKEGSNRLLIYLAAVSVFAAPMAYAPLLFYAYLGSFILYLATLFLLERKKSTFKKALVVFAVLVATNSFWMIPNIYSVFNQSETIQNAKINLLFSPEAFLRNKEFGEFKDVIIHKGFLFSWREYDDTKGEYVELLDEWNAHLNDTLTLGLTYLPAVMFVEGIAFILIRRKKIGVALLPVTLFSMFFLTNENPPTGFLYSVLRDNFSIFEEALRMPFTKFSIIFMFLASFYFGWVNYEIFTLFAKHSKKRILSTVQAGMIVVVLLYIMLPAFRGGLISPSMRIDIPDEYFKLNNYFEDKEGARILKLPAYTHWGWIYYDWGYEGAGFNWFGLNADTFDRDFDRWSRENETVYHQASHALYSKDTKGFEAVLENYGITHILLDESVINPDGNEESLFVDESQAMFESLEKIKLAERIGFLSVYEFATGEKDNRVAKIKANTDYFSEDSVYETYSQYVDYDTGLYYPFVNFDKRGPVGISLDGEEVFIDAKLDEPYIGETMYVPDYVRAQQNLPLKVFIRELDKGSLQARFQLEKPTVYVNGEETKFDSLEKSYEFTFGENRPGFISIYDRTFRLSGIDLGKEAYVGSVLVPRTEPVELILFADEAKVQDDLVSSLTLQNPRWCSDPERTLPVRKKEGNFLLEFGPESICLGQRFTLTDTVLTKIEFTTQSVFDIYPRICVAEYGKEGCINKSVPSNFEIQSDVKSYEYTLPMPAGDYFIDLVIQAQEEISGSINYKDFSVETYPFVNRETVDLGTDLIQMSEKDEIPLSDPVRHLEVKYPYYAETEENLALNRGHAVPVNCDLEKDGQAYKVIEDGKIKYRAIGGGASCDFLDFPTLDHSQGYLMNIKGGNTIGRSLKFSIFNKATGRNENEYLLPEGEFNQVYVIMPKSGEEDGYVLNYETRSFGKLPSENYIESVGFIPVPISWLRGIVAAQDKLRYIENADVILDSSLGHTHYEFSTSQSGDSRLFVFDQAYNKGWKAYKVDSQINNLKLIFPFLFGKELEHVEVSSWANGWIIPSGSEQETKIIVVFWPQYLQYAGFVVGILIIAMLTVASFRLTKTVSKG